MALFNRKTSLITSLEAKAQTLAVRSTSSQDAAAAYRQAAVDAEQDAQVAATQADAVTQAVGILDAAGVTI